MAAEGELISGRYRLVFKVGRGGMGVVWRAHDEVLDRIVAVKQLLVGSELSDAGTENVIERAQREGRIAARLQHPNAIVVHDVVLHDDLPWLVMEYLASKSLAAVIVSRQRLLVRNVVRLGGKIAAALAAAHQAGIVHRDVKPENILIGTDGQVKITDFGLSRAIGETTMTKSGLIAGTPGFLAPEVATGAEAGYPSDVFSLGATLYTAVEGQPPFGDHDNKIVLLMRSARGQVIPPRHAGRFTPMLMSLLATDPDMRPTMRQVHEALVGRRRVAVAPRRARQPRQDQADSAQEPASAERMAPPVEEALSDGEVSVQSPDSSSRQRVIGVLAALVVTLGVVFGIMIILARGGDSPTGKQSPGVSARTSAPSASGATSADSACQAVALGTFPGGTGYEVTVEVRNLRSQQPLPGWKVRWTFPDKRTVKTVIGGMLTQSVVGSQVSIVVESANLVGPLSTDKFTFIVGGDDQVLANLTMQCSSTG